MHKSIFFLTTLLLSINLQAFQLKVNSLRLKATQPETLHSLIYRDSNVGFEKVIYDLDPINNERIGFFADINGLLIGYSIDPFTSERETKTTDIILSSEKIKNSKISFNYQTLEGFNTKAYNASNSSTSEKRFTEKTKSTKLEFFGLHNLYTFKGTSLFSHFFQNKPKTGNKHKFSLSLVGAWSVRRLKLENPNGILFRPNFFTTDPITYNKINAFSLNSSAGPLVSFGLKQNVNVFAEGKIGVGYFENLDSNQALKQSGTEFISSFGSGASWTSKDQRFLVILKAWAQKGRHIETFFGDLSLIYFL